MQHQTTNILIKKLDRTTSERLDAVKRDMNMLEKLFNDLPEKKFDDLEKRIALFALNEHSERIQRALSDLIKNTKLDNESDRKYFDNLAQKLKELSDKIKKNLPIRNLEEKETSIVVAGAGPIGYYSAVSLLNKTEQHNSNVVLVADKYSDFPTRGGGINPWVLEDYAVSLGLGKSKSDDTRRPYIKKLLDYVTLREQGDHSIKHLDMLGRASYLALGGRVVSGVINWNALEKDDANSLTVNYDPSAGTKNSVPIHQVKCVVNAMGANATYPENIKRQQFSSEEDKHVLRTHCAQVNVSVTPQLLEKLIQLRDHYYAQKNAWLVPFFFHGYYLRPMDKMPEQLQEGIIYVKKLENNNIKYAVKTPQGNIVTDEIDEKLLPKDMPLFSFTATSAILKITSERNHTNFGKQGKDGNYKIQIFPNLTKNESDFLDKLVTHLYESSFNGLYEAQKSEFRITLKTILFLEFISAKANIDLGLHDSNIMTLRDKIKTGKQLCREFKIPIPSAPPQEIVTLLGTQAVATWVGAAALPTVINGRFVPTGVAHAEAIIEHLVQNKFHSGQLDEKTKPGEIFKRWSQDVNEFVQAERKNSKDTSEEMYRYFSRMYKLSEEFKKFELPTPVQNSSPSTEHIQLDSHASSTTNSTEMKRISR